MTRKVRVGVLFGGQSAEHEISLQSARSIIENIDAKKYEVIPIGIDKKGSWFFLSIAQFFLIFEKKCLPAFQGEESHITLDKKSVKNVVFSPCVLRKNLDVIFPALHGPYGEDGTVQGLAKLANLPCVGSGVLSSALCMDKGMMKCLLRDAGFLIPSFQYFKCQQSIDIKQLIHEIKLPLFVKPASLGSSIGISKVCKLEKLLPAIHLAFQYDKKILVEECIQGREIECSVLGNIDPKASLPGELIPKYDFYSYEAKYMDDEGVVFHLPADLSVEMVGRIQKLALEVFLLFECEGMARVDFFVQKDGKILINELNTIPGFTTISLYPKLWELSGIPYPKLIDHLIQLALQQDVKRKSLKMNICASSFAFQ